MKKLLGLLLLFSLSVLSRNLAFAKDCLSLSFSAGDVCISIDKDDDEYTLDPELSDTNGTVSLRCDILLPDNTLKYVGACNGTFNYSKEDTRKIKLYVRMNNEYKSKEAYYDFDDGERGSSVGGSSSSNGDIDNFYLTTNDSSPETNDRVDLDIEARDDDDETVEDYDGTVDFKVYYRTSSSASWTLTTSSTYFEIDDEYEDGYEFDSSDDGEASLDNFIKFKKEYDYKVRVYDKDDSGAYGEKTFYVDDNGGGSSNGDIDNFYLTTNDSSPETNDRVDLDIEARDDDDETVEDYDGTVDFKVYYRTCSSCSWTLTTSSTYYEIDDDYEDGYEFDSSDDGEASLDNFIKFKKEYDYKVRVYDEDDSGAYGEKTFYVDDNGGGSSNGDIDNFYLTTDDSSPETNDRVDLDIEARDDDDETIEDYDGTVDFKVYYRTCSSCSWTLTTSSTYYEIDDDYEDGYEFDSSDDGEASLDNFIKFKREYDYKVRVYDEDDSGAYGEKIFYVDDNGGSSSNGDIDNFYLTTNDSSPETNDRVDLDIKARDDDDETVEDYDGTVDFKVYYRTSSSASWTLTTSSTYFEIDDEYEDGYEFDSSDDGEASLSDFIKFKKEYDYKVRVYDEDDSGAYGEKIFYVDDNGGSSSNGDFSSSDLDKIEAIYDQRKDLIDDLESDYPKLRTNTTRQNMSDDLYDEMEKIIEGEDSEYEDYDEFYDAFLDRYSYTIRVR